MKVKRVLLKILSIGNKTQYGITGDIQQLKERSNILRRFSRFTRIVDHGTVFESHMSLEMTFL